MANLTITAPAAVFEQGATSLVGFYDASGAPIRPMGSENNGVISWTVPDTDKNRDVFREAYKPSGNFKAEVKDARDDSLAPISLVDENKDLKAKLAQALAENEEMKARLAEQPETHEAHAPAGKGKK